MRCGMFPTWIPWPTNWSIRAGASAVRRSLLAAIQVCDLHREKKAEFKACIKYFHYLVEKGYFVEKFKPFKATWKNIAPMETSNGLVLSFPKANQISNGERDTLCLVAALLKARRKLQKGSSILIIDEVFDYLDDAKKYFGKAQYHLTQMIAQWKAEGRQLFPLILTHLDPSYFKNFTFKDQKVVSRRTAGTPTARLNISFQKEVVDRRQGFQALPAFRPQRLRLERRFKRWDWTRKSPRRATSTRMSTTNWTIPGG